jgi:hypothetical protein
LRQARAVVPSIANPHNTCYHNLHLNANSPDPAQLAICGRDSTAWQQQGACRCNSEGTNGFETDKSCIIAQSMCYWCFFETAGLEFSRYAVSVHVHGRCPWPAIASSAFQASVTLRTGHLRYCVISVLVCHPAEGLCHQHHGDTWACWLHCCC